ncbi:MAG: phage tail tape measure protein [Paracoccaceae bacterium]
MSAADMNVSLTLRLLDQFTATGRRFNQWVDRTRGNADRLGTSLGGAVRSRFSTANVEAALARSEERISAARGRLQGALGMALTLAAPVYMAGNFEEELIHFANLAEIGEERVGQLRGEIDQLRRDTGQSNTQVLTGLEALVGKGMGLDEAIASLRATGRLATATRADIAETANSGFAVMSNMKVAPDALAQAFDIMAASGKEGAFELGAMARHFPTITAGARALGIEGVEGVASLSAALQVAMASAGSEDQAANNLVNFLGKLTAPDTVRKFAEFGVDVQAELEGALSRGVDPLEHMLQVISDVTDGDAFKMGELFADRQVLDFLRAAIPGLEEYRRIRDVSLDAEGVVDADYARVMDGFNQSLRGARDAVTALFGASGVLLPILTDMLQGFTGMVNAVSTWTQENPELTATIVKGGAALLAFGVATRVASFGLALATGGIIRAASTFLLFDKEGRNVSRAARGWRAAARARRGLGRAMSGAVPRLILSSLVSPLRWTGRLIPRAPWVRLAGRLALSTLVSPLRWTAALLPMIPWTRRAGRLSWRSLIRPLVWGARAGLRFIPVIGWALLAGELAWHLLIKPLGWDDWISGIEWSRVIDQVSWWHFIPVIGWGMLAGKLAWNLLVEPVDWAAWVRDIDWTRLIRNLAWASVIPVIGWAAWFDFEWSSVLPDWDWGEIIPGLGAFLRKMGMEEPALMGAVRPQARPTIEGLNDRAAELRLDAAAAADHLAEVERQLAQIGTGPAVDGMRIPLEQQAQDLRETLRAISSELDAIAARGTVTGEGGPAPAAPLGSLRPAPRAPLSPAAVGTSARPVARSMTLEPAAAAALAAPIAEAVREGARQTQGSAGRRGTRGAAATVDPASYVAPQPNVEVESDFVSAPNVEVSVQVSMPISIDRRVQVDRAAVAAEAGRRAGRSAERAVRRGLDDAALV